MKINIFAAAISIASLSAGAVFGVGPDSSGSATQDYSFVLDSGNSYNIETATIDNVVYPSQDPCIFEVKYPDKDIRGKIVGF